MRKLALALTLGLLLAAGPMTRAFAGDKDNDDRDRIVKVIEKLLQESKGDRGKLIAEIEQVAKEILARGERGEEGECADDDDDDDAGAKDHDEAAEHASRGGFLGIQADKGEHCVKVVRVLPGTAAAKAGLRKGDELTELNGAEIVDVPDLLKKLGGLKPGSEVKLTVLRGTATKSLKATLGARPAEADEDDDDDDDDRGGPDNDGDDDDR